MRLLRRFAATLTAAVLMTATVVSAVQPCGMAAGDRDDTASGHIHHGGHGADTGEQLDAPAPADDVPSDWCPPLAPCALHLLDVGHAASIDVVPASRAMIVAVAARPPSHTVPPDLPPPRA